MIFFKSVTLKSINTMITVVFSFCLFLSCGYVVLNFIDLFGENKNELIQHNLIKAIKYCSMGGWFVLILYTVMRFFLKAKIGFLTILKITGLLIFFLTLQFVFSIIIIITKY